MALSSPGVEVKVIDESFYTPAEPGTVPLIVVATAENKLNGAGDGIAPGTLKANAGQVYLITSQKDLVDTFGDPVFKTDTNNNPIHAGEQNEYGLQAAYSLLGVSNRAYVVRADLDLNQIEASVDAPASNPNNGTHWLDTENSNWGIFEWDGRPITEGGQIFVNKVPLVITDPTKVVNGAPAPSVGKNGSYAIVAVDTDPDTPALTDTHPMTFWYRNNNSEWVKLGSTEWADGTLQFAIQPHTQVPQWKQSAEDAPTGSVWIKTTEPNLGARWRVKRFNSATQLFETVDAPLYSGAVEALSKLDKTGGGLNLAVGSLYVKYNSNDASPAEADFKIYRRKAATPTSIVSTKVTATSFTVTAPTTYTFTIAESLKGSATLGNDVEVSFELTAAAATNVNTVAEAILAAGLVNITVDVDNQNRLVITHELGGEIHLTDGDNSPLLALGFEAYNPSTGAGTVNLYTDTDGDHDFVASLWQPLVYVASGDAPTSLTEDGALWYSSIIDEVDIMVHDGSKWAGYQNVFAGTNPNGPFVRATRPEEQEDGSPLVTGDLWIDTSDIENFPMIYRYNNDLKKWFLVNKSDQSTDEGCLFADARYNTSGVNSDQPGSIVDLLISNYVDPDCPDPALYPQGMILWNLRRSGFNVREFRQNYIDTISDNPRFNDESMESYYPHRWVTVSANQDDGSGTFGRKAQRKVVVQALQALVNSNDQIRDEESRVFNLISCPGYPELIGELVSLNYDRGLTAFVVGDTPARLTADATSLNRWGYQSASSIRRQ